MVKRTLVVLSVLSLTLMVAGTSFGFMGGGCGGCCAPCPPLYVPVDCPDTGAAKTILKTWECKIEGPCPAPTPACGGSSCNNLRGPRPGILCCLAGVVGAPFDWIFGGFDGVYGCSGSCLPGLGGCPDDRGCGSPFMGGLAGVFGSGANMLSGETTIFGALW